MKWSWHISWLGLVPVLLEWLEKFNAMIEFPAKAREVTHMGLENMGVAETIGSALAVTVVLIGIGLHRTYRWWQKHHNRVPVMEFEDFIEA